MRAPLHKRTKEVEVRIDYAFNQEKALVEADVSHCSHLRCSHTCVTRVWPGVTGRDMRTFTSHTPSPGVPRTLATLIFCNI